MFDPLLFAWNAILDRSASELLGAVIGATAVSLIMSCLYVGARRKLRDNPILLTALFLLTSLASMALAVGYLEHSEASRAQFNVYLGPIGGEAQHLVAPAVTRRDF